MTDMNHLTDDQIKAEIKQIEAKQDDLGKQLAELDGALSGLRSELSFRQYGGRPGSRVIHRGKEYEVESVHGRIPTWRYGVPITKSGRPGVRAVCLYDYWQPKP